MKPQIIDRYVYVKGKKISEATSKSNLDGNEILPLAYNDVNYNTTVDQISEYVDKVHDYLTTENYNDLKGQIDSERTNRQEADSELNQSIQDTKSELHSTISGVESELLGEVNDLQEQIDSINDTGIAKGVTLDTAQTITGEKTFTTVPKSTADATEDIDLVNKKYVDDAVQDVDVDLSGYATEVWVNEQGFARTSDIPEGLEIGETTGTAFDGGRGKTVEDVIGRLYTGYYDQYVASAGTIDGIIKFTNNNPDFVSVSIHSVNLNKDIPNVSDYRSTIVSATTTNAGVMSAADKQKLDSIPTLTTSGDGTKYLSDDGTYRTIETPDLSNYLTQDDKTELETEIGDLSENVNGQITELQKKDSTIEGNVTNLTETVSTINDTVSGLDGKYLPLSGGTLDGSIYFDSALSTEENPIHDLIINRSGGSQYITVGSLGTIEVRDGDIGNNGDFVTDTGSDFLKRNPKNPGIEYRAVMTTTNQYAGNQKNVNYISQVTQSIYDGLSTKDANTLYIITE